MRPEKIVVFAPLPPKENGIADYVAEQLPFHAHCAHTIAVIENGAPEPVGLPAGVTVLRLEEYLACRGELLRFPHIFHVGNNPDHGYLLPVLYSTPGVVVVHDLGLHHLIDTQTLVRGNRIGYAWALWQQYGAAGKLLGQQFLEHQLKGQVMPQQLALNGAVLHAARHVIVHSAYSAERIRSELPALPVTVIPHHLSPKVHAYHPARRIEARRALGLPEAGAVITSLGFINRHKQVEPVLDALVTMRAEGRKFVYVLAGRCRREEYDVYAEIARRGLDDCVRVTGYLDEDAFFKHVVAADLIVNLRYPSGGETSGTMTRALGLGRCCVVVNIGPFGEIPDHCAVKIDWDPDFVTRLGVALRRLLDEPATRGAFEVAARDWVGRTHAIKATTDRYHEVLASLPAIDGDGATLLGQLGVQVREFDDEVLVEETLASCADSLRQAVAEGAGHLWWRQSLVARAAAGVIPPAVVSDSSAVLQVLESHLCHAPGSVVLTSPESVAIDGLAPEAYRASASLLAVLPLSGVADDPVRSLCFLNWRLPVGGELVLVLRHDMQLPGLVPLSPSAWHAYLEASGFEVLSAHQAPADITYSDFVADEVEWAFRARKLSERIDRFPQPFYADQRACHLVLGTVAQLPPFVGFGGGHA